LTELQSGERITNLTEEEVQRFIRFKLEKKIAQLPYGFWRCDKGKIHSKIAIKYLIEKHLGLKLEEVPMKVSAKTFHDAGLFRILVEFYDSSYFKALDYTYPGYFKPWQFPKGMTGIWKGQSGYNRSLEAIKFIIKSLEIKEEDIPRKITYQTFKDYGLGGMLQTLYNSSPYQAINSLYPDRFKPWEFSVKNYWKNETIDTAREATNWLVEIKLKLKPKDTNLIRRKHFLQNNLGQMLKIFYKNSHLLALEDAYNF
jgi:hypothetical protein